MCKVNINTQVAVILTTYGAQVYNSYYEQFPDFCRPKVVSAGHQVRDALWEIMHIFGKCLHNGMVEVPFEGNEIEFLR